MAFGFQGWYTDTVDVYRNVEVMDGALTNFERQLILSGIPCRVYRSEDRPVSMSQTAASIKQSAKLACNNSVDIREGDELHITRGGALGQSNGTTRAFAGTPNYYYEPFGRVMAGISHQEIVLIEQKRVT